jgi:hypothetical protein
MASSTSKHEALSLIPSTVFKISSDIDKCHLRTIISERREIGADNPITIPVYCLDPRTRIQRGKPRRNQQAS